MRNKRTVQSGAICIDEYAWMDNAEQQSPCLVLGYVLDACGGTDYTVTPLQNSTYHYDPLNSTTANDCTCSWSAYNLFQACALCQGPDMGASIFNWDPYKAVCNNSILAFPSNIRLSNSTSIPFWAMTNPDTWDDSRFNANQAQQLIEGQPDFRSPAVLPTSPEKKSETAPIAGGVVGGILFLGIFIITLSCWRRRRARKDYWGPYRHGSRNSSTAWVFGKTRGAHGRSQSGQSDLSGHSDAYLYKPVDPYHRTTSPERIGQSVTPLGTSFASIGSIGEVVETPMPIFRANHPITMSPPPIPRELPDNVTPNTQEEEPEGGNVWERAVRGLKNFRFGQSRPGILPLQGSTQGHGRSWSGTSNVSTGTTGSNTSYTSYFSLSSLGRSGHSHSHSHSHSHTHPHSRSHSRSLSFGILDAFTPPTGNQGQITPWTPEADPRLLVADPHGILAYNQSSTETITLEPHSDSDREARRHRRGRRHNTSRDNSDVVAEPFSPPRSRHPSDLMTMTQSPSPPTRPRMFTTVTQSPSPPARIRADGSRTPSGSRTRTRDHSSARRHRHSRSRGHTHPQSRVHFDSSSSSLALANLGTGTGQVPSGAERERRTPRPSRRKDPPSYSEATNSSTLQVVSRARSNSAGGNYR